MGVASLDLARPVNPRLGLAEAITTAFERGETVPQIAKRIHPTDGKARRALNQKLWRMVREDELLKLTIMQRAQGMMLAGLLPTISALNGRGARGRTDAAKLLFEASGFHNPRVQHEHSGEIKVKLEMPRPTFEQDADGAIVADAEVVEPT
jgi:hypothetical protein